MELLSLRATYLKETAGVSYARISLASGLSRGAFHLIATGARTDVEGTTLSGIARATGSSLEWLLNGIGAAPTKEEILTALAKVGFGDESDSESEVA